MSGFSQAQLNDLLADQLKDWLLDEGCLYREWRFTNWAKSAEAF